MGYVAAPVIGNNTPSCVPDGYAPINRDNPYIFYVPDEAVGGVCYVHIQAWWNHANVRIDEEMLKPDTARYKMKIVYDSGHLDISPSSTNAAVRGRVMVLRLEDAAYEDSVIVAPTDVGTTAEIGVWVDAYYVA